MKIFCLLLLVFSIFELSHAIAVMSIDLGSEFMKIAIVKPGVPMEIVLNKESRRKTPVAISLKSIEREYGEPAISMAIKYPKTAYFQLKELLAKSIDNPIVESFRQRYPYYDIKQDENTNTIYFQHNSDTTYTPEELIAMLLDYARELATDFAEQPIEAAVITVPPYFNQAERKALLRAADLVKLKVLQLINSNTAAALNYGVFRRKDFNETGNTLMFFDMGSSSTVATVAHFQMVRLKDDFEPNPQLTIRGVGFDRTLGGSEFTHRLMKHFAQQFKKDKNKDVFTNPKAILKLMKEAERVKSVLSANTDHVAQVESLMDDVDFKMKVTREEFEELCKDLFERVKNPINDALKSAGVTLDEIEAILLVGGATRVPKIQDELLKATKKSDLTKSLNTDEAVALGAVYQAAYQSKGYKVKKFHVKDAAMYPLVVDFERSNQQNSESSSNDNNNEKQTVRRTLFDHNNAYPQKKIMTFNKHDSDFTFYLNYGDLSYLRSDYVKIFGSLNVTQVDVVNVKEIFDKHKNELSKGIKVHFNMDDSGILNVDKIDVSFEKSLNETTDEESTLSKIGNKISSFFSGGSASTEDEDNTKSTENKDNLNNNNNNNNNMNTTNNNNNIKNEEKGQEKKIEDSEKPSNQTATNATLDGSAKNETKKTPNIIKENIEFEVTSLDMPEIEDEDIEKTRKRLKEIKDKEMENRKRASAINALESFIYDTKSKLQETEFEKCSTAEERETITTKLNEADEWLSDTDEKVETKAFSEKLSELKKITKDVYYRVQEKRLRPKKLDELKEFLNASINFLATAWNMTGEDKPFTETEVTTLSNLINTTKEWRAKMLNEQNKVADHETPKLLSSDINDKIDSLRREINYLITKAKYFKPKPKTTTKSPKKETKDENKTTDANTNESNGNDNKEESIKQDSDQQFSEEDAKKLENMFESASEEKTEETKHKKSKKTTDEQDSSEPLEIDDGQSETPNPEL